MEELERKIIKIQKSTRTSVPAFANVHNNLRVRFKWYYFWHMLPQSKVVHWGILGLVLLVASTSVLASFFGNPKLGEAATETLDTPVAWSGDCSIFSDPPGDVGSEAAKTDLDKIDTKDEGQWWGSTHSASDGTHTDHCQEYRFDNVNTSLTSLTASHEGYNSASHPTQGQRSTTIYIWNFTTSAWDVGGTHSNGSDTVISVTKNSSDYVSSGHTVYVRVVAQGYAYLGAYTAGHLYTDQVKLEVTATTPTIDNHDIQPVKGWHGNTSGNLPTPPSGTAASSTELTNARSSNDTRFEKTVSGGDAPYQMFRFDSVNNSAGLLPFFEGYGNTTGCGDSSVIYFYIWNNNTSSWDQVAARTSPAESIDRVYSSEVTSSTNYVNSSKQLYLGVKSAGCAAGSGTLYTDNIYLEVQGQVASTLKHPYYRFRDDSTGLNTNGGWLAAENSQASVSMNTTARLRISIYKSAGDISSEKFKFQWAKNSNCSSVSSWNDLSSSGDIQYAADSTKLPGTISSAWLTAQGGSTWVNGYGIEQTSTTSRVNMGTDLYHTELETSWKFNTGLTPGDNYCFRVIKDDKTISSDRDLDYAHSVYPAASPANPTPADPTNAYVDSATTSALTIHWSDNSSNETGFKVQEKVDCSGSWSTVTTTGAGATSYPRTGLSQNSSYCYRVYATNGAGDSANPTNTARGKTHASKLEPKTDTLDNHITFRLRGTNAGGPSINGPIADKASGSSAATFTRNDADATYIADDDTIQDVQNSNDARIEKISTSDNSRAPGGAVRIEEARTNYLLRSSYESDGDANGTADGWNNYANSGATGTRTWEAGGIHGGYAQRFSRDDTSTPGKNFGVYQARNNIGLSGNTTYTFSAYVKPNSYTGAETFRLYVSWRDSTPATIGNGSCTWNMSDLTLGQWQRVTCTKTSPANTTGIYMYVSLNSSGADSGDISVDGIQFEHGDFATSYIPTTAATATRNVETLKYASASNVNANAGTFSAWVKPDWASDHTNNTGSSFYATIFDTGYSVGDGGMFLAFLKGNGSSVTDIGFWQNQVASNVRLIDSPNVSFSANDWIHIAVTYQAGQPAKLYLNGSLLTTGTINAENNKTDGNLNIGTWSDKFDGLIADFTAFNTALTAEDIQGIYNGYGPSNVRITTPPTTEDQLTVTWQDNSSNESATGGFTVENRETGSDWAGTTNKDANVTTHDEAGLNTNKQYKFRLRANMANYYSDWQESSSSVYTLAHMPSAPAVYADAGDNPTSKLKVILDANGNPSGTAYRLTRDTNPLGAFSTTVQSWTAHNDGDTIADSSLSADSNYCYKMRARNGDNIETNDSLHCASTRAVRLEPNATLQGYINNGIRLRYNSSDGRGDSNETATLTRSDTDATYTGGDGKLYTVSNSNDPRIEKVADKEGGSNVPPGRAVRIEEARTNNLLNSGFELGNTDNWVANGNANISASTSQVKENSYSVYVDYTSTTGTYEGIRQQVSSILDQNTTYVMSDWVYVPSGASLSRNFEIHAHVAGTFGSCSGNYNYSTLNSSSEYNFNKDTSPRDQWVYLKRIIKTNDCGTADKFTLRWYSMATGGADETGVYYLDAVQIEKGDFATSYIPTTTAAAIRNAETLTYPVSGNISGTAGTLSMWVKPDWTSYASGADRNNIFHYGTAGTDGFLLRDNGNASYGFELQYYGSSTVTMRSSPAISANTWHHILVTWGASGVTFYVDGSAVLAWIGDPSTVMNNPGSSGNFYVGGRSGGYSPANSLISDITIFNTALNADTVEGLYNGYGPSGVAIADPGQTDIDRLTATWQDNSSNEDDFSVEYKQTADCTETAGWSSAGSQPADTTSYQRTGLSTNTQYCFRLRGSVSSYDSGWDTPTGSKYTMIETPTGITFDDIQTGNIQISATGSFTNLTAGSSGLQFTETLTSPGGGGDACFDWGQTNSCNDTGLSLNTLYTYKAQARNGDGLTTAETTTASKYTLATQPNFTSLTADGTSAVKVVAGKNGNPESGDWENGADTEYAIYNQTLGNWLGTDGVADEAAEVWANYSGWGGATGLNNTGLSTNTQYTYQIKAKNGDGAETGSSSNSRYTHIESPTGITFATIGENSLELQADTSLSNLSAGSSRAVFTFGSSPTGGVGGASSGDIHANSYTNNGLDDNDQYCYQVEAFNGDNISSTGAPVPVGNACKYTLALAVAGETASGNYNETDGYLTDLSWNAHNATNVEVVRGGQICKIPGTTCDDTGLNPNTLYSYDIYSYNGDDVANPSFVTVFDTTPPDKPDNLSATSVTTATAKVLWDAVTAADTYEVCFGQNADGSDMTDCTSGISDVYYDKAGLTPGTTYYYKVNATNINGIGAYSHGTGVWSTPPPYPSFTTSAADRLIVVAPGQTFTNGVGVTGVPDHQSACTSFNFDVYAVDSNNWIDPGKNGEVSISSSDPNADLPANFNLVAGQKLSNNIELKAAASSSIVASYVPGGLSNGSQFITVDPGSTNGSQSTVSVSPSESLPTGQSFTAEVYLRDICNNALSGHTVAVSTNNNDQITYSGDSQTTDASGKVTAYITSNDPHTSSLTIIDNTDGVTLPYHPEVTWVASGEAELAAKISGPQKAVVATDIDFDGLGSTGNIARYEWIVYDVYYDKTKAKTVEEKPADTVTYAADKEGNVASFKTDKVGKSTNEQVASAAESGVQIIQSNIKNKAQLEREAKEVASHKKPLSVKAYEKAKGYIEKVTQKVSDWVKGWFKNDKTSKVNKASFIPAAFAVESKLGPEISQTFSATGYYDVYLRVTDGSGDNAEAVHQILIVPPAPVITSIERAGDDIVISGTSWPDINIDLYFSPGFVSGSIGQTRSSGAGVWSFTHPSSEFAAGEYLVYAIAVDDHDISSDKSNEVVFKITLDGDVVIVSPLPEGPSRKLLDSLKALSLIASSLALVASVGSILLGLNFFNILPYLYYLFTMLMEKLGLTKKREPWGIVYDAITKVPVELAIVRIFDVTNNRLLETRVTGKDGKFGFLVRPGTYKISISKYGYDFSSQYVKKGKKSDDVYTNIYHGAAFSITPEKRLVNFNVPIDPVNKEKKKQGLFKKIINGLLTSRHYVKKIIIPLLALAIVIALITYSVTGENINVIIAVIMAILMLWEVYDKVQYRSWGVVYNSSTKKPIAGAQVRIYDQEYNKLKEVRTTDFEGRFGFIVPPGKYTLEVEKEGFRFPSTRIRLKNDGRYHYIYHGEEIRKKPKDSVVSANIPLDPK